MAQLTIKINNRIKQKQNMEQKELPQEPKDLIIQMTDCILRAEDATEKELAVNCTQLAMAHYEPQVTRLEKLAYEHQVEIADYLKELQAKDSRIEFLQKEILGHELINEDKDTTIKEQAEQIEKLTGLLRLKILEIEGYHPAFTGDEQVKEGIWQSYKEQHGI